MKDDINPGISACYSAAIPSYLPAYQDVSDLSIRISCL
jgi:hypothetical protein